MHGVPLLIEQAPLSHLKLLLPVVQLHEEAMRAIPVSIDYVCLSIAIEVC